MKYYVTGGLGVIGSCFAEAMLKEGHQVAILDAAEEYRNKWMAQYLKDKYGHNVIIHIERMETSKFTDLESYDFILHAAAHTGIPHSAVDPVDDWLSNAEATRNLLERLRKMDKKIPMVALSSVKPYKVDNMSYVEHSNKTKYTWLGDIKGISESHILEPDEPYAASKMAQSALVMAYGRTYNLPVMVFRCSNLYGPAPSHGPRHGWLTWFCLSAVLEREIEVQGTGLQVRDMLFSDDVISAVLTAFKHIDSIKGNVYNIGGGYNNSLSVIEAVQYIKVLYGDVKVRNGPGRQHEDPIFITDYSKFKKATGWEPRVSLIEGISKIIKWSEENKADIQKIYDWVK